MGPRSNERGNGEKDIIVRFTAEASMGPRSNERGNELLQQLQQENERCFNGATFK